VAPTGTAHRHPADRQARLEHPLHAAGRDVPDGHLGHRTGFHHPDDGVHRAAGSGVRLRDRRLDRHRHRPADERLAGHRRLRPPGPGAGQPGPSRPRLGDGRLPARRRPGVQRRQRQRRRAGHRRDVRAGPQDRRRTVGAHRDRDLPEQAGRGRRRPDRGRPRAAHDRADHLHRGHLRPARRPGAEERRPPRGGVLPGDHDAGRGHHRRLHRLRGRPPTARLRGHRTAARPGHHPRLDHRHHHHRDHAHRPLPGDPGRGHGRRRPRRREPGGQRLPAGGRRGRPAGLRHRPVGGLYHQHHRGLLHLGVVRDLPDAHQRPHPHDPGVRLHRGHHAGVRAGRRRADHAAGVRRRLQRPPAADRHRRAAVGGHPPGRPAERLPLPAVAAGRRLGRVAADALPGGQLRPPGARAVLM
ncbi:MAG: Uncharacterized metal ion transporter YcsG, Mn(2+)/Fe(2+) NRAMP family, partial [uncultured Blastococcus sp.]